MKNANCLNEFTFFYTQIKEQKTDVSANWWDVYNVPAVKNANLKWNKNGFIWGTVSESRSTHLLLHFYILF